MRLKAKEVTEIPLTMPEIKNLIKSQFNKGDVLHVIKSKRRLTKKEVVFIQGFDSFFTAETVINPYYSETLTIAYADLLVGNIAIQEIQTMKPIEK